jgi:CNT family concentrative nucleoside transporter
MTNSELHAIMVGGFATVAGGVMAAYVAMLQDKFPDIAGHLIAASVMGAPATLVIAKVMVPETEVSTTSGTALVDVKKVDVNAIDAATRGAAEGLTLALNVAAMLLAFVALVALANAVIGLPFMAYGYLVGEPSIEPWTLQQILGYGLWPFAFMMGIPPADCAAVAALLGEKIVLNEFVAYLHLAADLGGPTPMSDRAIVITTYALCGFANFSSIAIQIGGIGGMAPERRGDLARLGLRAMIGGTLATCMTACIVGIVS